MISNARCEGPLCALISAVQLIAASLPKRTSRFVCPCWRPTCDFACTKPKTAGPKVVPFPPDILARIAEMAAAHRNLPVPDLAGRKVDFANETLAHRRLIRRP